MKFNGNEYDKIGDASFYKKRKSNAGAWIFWGFVALVIFAALAG